ncbi:MAG: hypothetical protein CBC60_00650 [Betaproteobacteria bacterium TMED100]|nr:MAG: hypothetical protein CBC60_00650 [Betaproteobacteria bacterium TMED100]
MKIVIDLQGAQACNSKRGIGRYSKAIVLEICARFSHEYDIHFLINGAFLSEGLSLKNSFKSLVPKFNFHTFFPSANTTNNLMSSQERERSYVVREAVLDRIKPNVVLITSLFEGFVDNAVVKAQYCNSKYKTAVILYDLIPLLFPDYYLKSRHSKQWYEERLEQLKRIDCILTISEYSKKTVKKYLNISEKKLFNISGAVDHNLFFASEAKPKGNYIFSVSGIDPRKNLKFLIKSFSKSNLLLKNTYKLIITCHISQDDLDELKILIKNLKLNEEQIVFTGYVADEEMVRLYRGCRLFVFPSWQEGFGLPVLEAMACGAPVLAANAASIPEIGGDSLIYFDPFDVEDLSNKIVSVLNGPSDLSDQCLKNSKRAKNFEWSEVAKKSIEAIKSTIEAPPNKKLETINKEKKLNLAYFSPMPPDKSGIADYSEKLSKELKKYYEVTIVDYPKDPKSKWTNHLKYQSNDKFFSNPGSFDRVLYHFGNSHFHVEMFDFLKTNPGVSVLHDFFLGGVVSIRPDQYSLIFKNHGYSAIKKIIETSDSEFLKDHPANLSVFEDSYGVIVHSPYALKLIKKWYGSIALDKSRVVPLFRSKAERLPREIARETLKIDKNQFVVASFGHLGPNKLNDRLLDSWLDSSLAKTSQLVFVGQTGISEFDKTILSRIKKHKNQIQIRCTGWVNRREYLAWLSSVDVAVQLRTDTRGETSAAALDCLSYSIPTVVNAHGDLASLPKNTVMMIQNDFSDHELKKAIETLCFDEEYRSRLSEDGSNYVLNNHDIEKCGLAYYSAIEKFYDSKYSNVEGIFRVLKQSSCLPKHNLDKLNLIKALSSSLETVPRINKYYIDISELVNRDARTGIQRVVRNILRCMLLDPPVGYLVEPVYAKNDTIGYRKATKFVQDFLNLPHISGDELIDPSPGDVFLGLDLQPEVVLSQKKYLDMMYLKGVSLNFVVYDLIPIKHPNFFPDGARSIFNSWLETITNYDQVISISNSTKFDVENWLAKNHPYRLKSITNQKISLSSELSNEDRTIGSPKNAWFVRYTLKNHDVFLMVGTVEPRKEHSQVLDAFELIWADGVNKKLLIVGKQGWCIESLSKRIKKHPQFNKNLIWLEDCSDEFLQELYFKCKGLIASSWAEGYGLPLVEAFRSGLPVFCRDIPVFREVGEKFATFFSGKSPESFLRQFEEWDLSLKREANPKCESDESICWKKATKELEKITVKND